MPPFGAKLGHTIQERVDASIDELCADGYSAPEGFVLHDLRWSGPGRPTWDDLRNALYQRFTQDEPDERDLDARERWAG